MAKNFIFFIFFVFYTIWTPLSVSQESTAAVKFEDLNNYQQHLVNMVRKHYLKKNKLKELQKLLLLKALDKQTLNYIFSQEDFKKILTTKDIDGNTLIYLHVSTHGLTDNMFNTLTASKWGREIFITKNRFGYTPADYQLWLYGLTDNMFNTLASSKWGIEILITKDIYESTLIHSQAFQHGLTDNMFNALAASKWGIEILKTKDIDGNTPIHNQAFQHGLTDNMFNALTASKWGQKILTTKNRSGNTPIHLHAIKHGLTDNMFNTLAATEWGRKILTKKDKDGITLLHLLAKSAEPPLSFLKFLATNNLINILFEVNKEEVTVVEHLFGSNLYENLYKIYDLDINLYNDLISAASKRLNQKSTSNILEAAKDIPVKIDKKLYQEFSVDSTLFAQKLNNSFKHSFRYIKEYIKYHLGEDSLQRNISMKSRNLEAHELHKKLLLKNVKNYPSEIIPIFMDILKTKSDIHSSHEQLLSEVLQYGLNKKLIKVSDLMVLLKTNPQFLVKKLALNTLAHTNMSLAQANELKSNIATIKNKNLKSLALDVYKNQSSVEVDYLLEIIQEIQSLGKSTSSQNEIDDSFFKLSYEYITKLSELSLDKRKEFNEIVQGQILQIKNKQKNKSQSSNQEKVLKDLLRLLQRNKAMIEAVIQIQDNKIH